MDSIIQTATNNLNDSLEFYKKLNFSILSENDSTYLSDGSVIIEVNPDRYARPTIKLYHSSWLDISKELSNVSDIYETNDGFILSDPSGCLIQLIETDETLNFDLPEKSSSVLGNFAGISLETIAIERSLEIWRLLGFKEDTGSVEEGWVSLTNKDDLSISLMIPNICPHLFFNPSFTYFNGEDNIEVISKIKELKIPITEEITIFNDKQEVDNIIIRDPGGFGFFLFND